MPGWDEISSSDWDEPDDTSDDHAVAPSSSGVAALAAAEGAEPGGEGGKTGGNGGEPGGKGDKAPQHEQLNIGVFNVGGPRARGEEMYGRNAFGLPIFLGLCLEVNQEHIEQWTKPCRTWRPASAEEPLEAPPQGLCAGGGSRVKNGSRPSTKTSPSWA